jgi:hypothetical protein
MTGRPRAPGLPAAAYRSQAFRRSVGILPWSCHFASLSRSKGAQDRPTSQAAPICHAGLERIGPPAGDLGPVTACPAGRHGHQGRARAGLCPKGCSKGLVAGAFGLQLVRPGQCDEAPAADRSGRWHLSADGA